jgi:hypothetical protein
MKKRLMNSLFIWFKFSLMYEGKGRGQKSFGASQFTPFSVRQEQKKRMPGFQTSVHWN